MQTEIRSRRVELTEAFRRQIEGRLRAAFDRFTHDVARVRVRFADLNGPRGGVDKRCQVALDLRPGGQVLVEADAERVDLALSEALSRASTALTRHLRRVARPVRGAAGRFPADPTFEPAA